MKGNTMRQAYNKAQQADYIMIGFSYQGILYYYRASVRELLKTSKYDHTSKSHGRLTCLRFKPTATEKKAMISNGAIALGDSNIFFNKHKRADENRGQTWERYLCQHFNGTPCENRTWWTGGDFNACGAIIQVKYENATICTAKQCRERR